MHDPLDVSHDVSAALNRNEPVVALESCVVAHGLEKPANLRAAEAMQAAVRAAGAVPAMIGVIDGKLRVGLSNEEIERLAASKVSKLAVRDLPYAITSRLSGGTTVSATIRIASAVGLLVVATGGIGGVHRNYAETLDASADLWELVRTPAMLVCSGPKAVLDVAATTEWLETHSVPVYGWQTDELPAFYSRSSGVPIPKVENAREFVEIARVSGGAMGVRCATLVAVPIPAADELDVAAEIEQAVGEARAKGIIGHELTPYLLRRVGELTKGRSVKANLALLANNAKVAAQIAVELARASGSRMGFIA